MLNVFALLVMVGAAADGAVVVSWEFSEEAACAAWQANAHFTEVACESGALRARAIDWDPFFTCGGLDIPANAAQAVHLRLRATAGGRGQLFWTGRTAGQHGGFDGDKVTNFDVQGGRNFEDIVIRPYWQAEETIRQLRLDLYEGAAFEIAAIVVVEDAGPVLAGERLQWEADRAPAAWDWRRLNDGRMLASPPLAIPLDNLGWVSLTARASADTAITLHWSTTAMTGSRQETVYVRAGEADRHYHVELRGHPQWTGNLAGLHFLLPDPDTVAITSVTLADQPEGPPELEVTYFGFENGVNRAGRNESVLAQFINRGGERASPGALRLELPAAVEVVDGPMGEEDVRLMHGDVAEMRWTVQADAPGAYTVQMHAHKLAKPAVAVLDFAQPMSLSETYVPEPRPVETSHDILAYYFPGWDASAKWECIRATAPVRRPLLGYYDEANVECVDWQIKWAVENGIRAFLVDWYWSEGGQSLLHWFDAYRQARYRDYLQVALMWANHNAPGTHSREDWRAVTREWIDKYFTLETYYQVDGMPAVYIWDAQAIRADLGGSEEAAAALAESQEMARAAGHKGIAFIVLQHHVNETEATLWEKEGYHGHTSYHEWGDAYQMAPTPSQGRFDDVVATSPDGWERRRALSEALKYYPVVDTGWDSRPWHGPNATAFHGRTVDGFRTLLQSARAFCEQHGKPSIILGPLNEWGEGSYIEPNLEFGFGMYEALREVFGKGDPAAWPVNLSPRDVGLGPYDFPPVPRAYAWRFESGLEGWAAMMNISNLRVEDGRMCFETTSGDPALLLATSGLSALRFGKLHIRMRVAGPAPEHPQAQLFWSIGASPASEATSLRFPLITDGAFHEYQINLAEHPRWRGRVSTLRFDPCEFNGAQVCLDSFVFVEE